MRWLLALFWRGLGLLAGLGLLGALFVAAGIGGFLVTLRGFEQYAPPPPAHTVPAPAVAPAPELTRERLDALLEGEAPPSATAEPTPHPEEPAEPKPADPPTPPEAADAPTAPDAAAADAPTAPDAAAPAPTVPAPTVPPQVALSRTIAAVRLNRPADPALIKLLSCDQLSLARNWIWAERGYAFHSEPGRLMMSSQSGYRADPSLSPDDVESKLTEVDQGNRNMLTAQIKASACPCADTMANRPCPE
jgi:hypothetical protein